MGVPVSRSIYPEMAEENAVRQFKEGAWKGIPKVGGAKGMPNRRRALDAGPCTYADLDTAETFGIAGSGVHQGKECDSRCKGVWRAEAQFCWATLLGTRVLRVDGGA